MTAWERELKEAKEELRTEYLLDPDMDWRQWCYETANSIPPLSTHNMLVWAQEDLWLAFAEGTGAIFDILKDVIARKSCRELEEYSNELETERAKVASSIEDYVWDNYEVFAAYSRENAAKHLAVDVAGEHGLLTSRQDESGVLHFSVPGWIEAMVKELVEELEERT